MAPPAGPPSDSVLLVEGPDDAHVVRHVSQRSDAIADFSIRQKCGVEKLLAAIDTEVQTSGLRAMGILVDANEDVAARWDAVKGRLAPAKVALPDSPVPSGTIVEGRPHDGIPRVGVWLMPDNGSPGELEDFVAQMIPAGDAVWPLSKIYIDGIPCAEKKFRPKKKKRAQVHAWLAAREDPRLMGAAIGAGDLAVDGPLCQEFVSWLKALFT
jgi:hypothetical protein